MFIFFHWLLGLYLCRLKLVLTRLLYPVTAVFPGIKLVREQENPIQEKHRQIPRRGQHVRGKDRSQRDQRVGSRQPGKLPVHSQLSRWADPRPADHIETSSTAFFYTRADADGSQVLLPEPRLRHSVSVAVSFRLTGWISLTNPVIRSGFLSPLVPFFFFFLLSLFAVCLFHSSSSSLSLSVPVIDLLVSWTLIFSCLLSGWPCACH